MVFLICFFTIFYFFDDVLCCDADGVGTKHYRLSEIQMIETLDPVKVGGGSYTLSISVGKTVVGCRF